MPRWNGSNRRRISIFEGRLKLAGEIWIARLPRPPGTACAPAGQKRGPASEVGWSVGMGKFFVQGPIAVSKRRGRGG